VQRRVEVSRSRRDAGSGGQTGLVVEADDLPLVTRCVTLTAVIRSFRDKDTQRLWNRERVRRFGPDVRRSALKRLTRLDAAESLDDLRAFPGNRLEKLRGDRQGQHSIRINDQWRICFVWTDAGPDDVEIVDYH